MDITTVEQYLGSLPEERRAVLERVRECILGSLPAGFIERCSYGMITYEIPLERYPSTYNKQSLTYVALAAQKNHFAVYAMCAYTAGKEQWLREAFARVGKNIEMGKSCIRFRRLDDLPLDVIAELVGSMTPDDYISIYESARNGK